MKKLQKYKKYLASVLAILVAAGLTGTFAYAKGGENKQEESSIETEITEDTADAVMNRSSDALTAQKDETVYVIASADGKVDKIIVSDWLQNAAGAEQLKDTSDLKDITNVKSDAGYQMKENGALVWDTKGDDLYYQGVSEKSLPVDLQVTYLLDGKQITAEELAGKSGKVTIRYSYRNNQYQTVEINGKQEKIYVPFGMLTGVMLDNDKFSNVTVNNGKLFSDGNRTIVAGFALPGMQENLAIDPEVFELPETVEITADVKNFELGMTVSIATNGLFNDIDTEKINGLDDLTGGLGQMTDAMKQLMDGSSQLYNGLATLLDKSGELVSGIHQLADGAKQLKNGADSLASGADSLKAGTAQLASGAAALKTGTAALAAGAQQLQGGAAQLAAGAGSLKDGTAQLSDGTGSLKAGTGQLADGSTQLQSGAAQLSEGLSTLTQNNDALNGGAKQVFDTLLSTANAQIQAAGLEAPELTVENYAETLNAVIASLDKDAVYQKALNEVTKAVEAKRGYIQDQVTAAVKAQVKAAVETQVTAQVQEAVLEEVRKNEALIREAVIQQAAGMSAAQYDQAVAAGMISEETQQAIEAAITKTINEKVEEQMQTETVQQKIALLTGQYTDDRMEAIEVQSMIAQNTEAQVQKAIADTMAGEEVQQKLAAASAGAQALIQLKTQLDSYNAFYMGLQQYTAGVSAAANGASQLKEGIDSLQAGAVQVDAGAAQVNAGAAQLDAGAGELKSGAEQVSSGAASLQSGIAQVDGGAGSLQSGAQQLDGGVSSLQSGAKQLANGAGALYDGILKLENGVPALTDGITKLKGGAMQLSDGLKKFNDEGIQKLADALDGNLTETLERFRATVNVSKSYRSFSGLDAGMDGEVKFIYRTPDIAAKKEN